MAVVTVTDKELLLVEERPHVLRLYPAVAGARVDLQLAVKTMATNAAATAVPFHASASMMVSKQPNTSERLVCHLAAKDLVTPTPNGSSLNLSGFVSDSQLRWIENMRAGGDLVLHLGLVLDTAGERIQRFRADEYVYLHGSVWGAELEKVDAATLVEVLVPMPTSKAYADAVVTVREGRDLLRAGDEPKDIDSALVRARMALETVRRKLRTASVSRNAPSDPTQRSLAEREAVLVEALFSYLSGAAHKDPITKTFEYTRANAIMALATVAGIIRAVSERP